MSDILESIPLIIYSKTAGTYLPDLEIYVDGIKSRFLFDTGAISSQIMSDSHTNKYESLGKKESKGTSGIGTNQDVIILSEVQFGQRVYKNFKIHRGERSILGLDFLQDLLIEIDLKCERLNLLSNFSRTESLEKINWLSTGHLTVPLKLCEMKIFALFDTGSDSTVIDEKFVRDNSGMFQLIRSEDGEDAHGNKVPSNVYSCHEVQIGHLKLQNVEMASFEFGAYLREKMENVPIILGNNIIYGSKWSFDLKSGFWCSYN
ncbi:MAG: aspartyl protease family protein [Bacteriovorax sp.]|nr:aspartyl protease family protein [Bacteriovorax sp.]